ncbi:MAG: DUF4013 domain-containing protein [Bacteroidota bacterium]|nr:DUF4013 domain-containing protein [Bacteroidota bacterium]
MKKLSDAFAFIFSDDDWFNKVLVGGLYLLLAPFLFGYIMILGFQVELMKRISNHETGMPMWRNFRSVFNSGTKAGIVSFFYLGCIVLFLLVLQIPLLSKTSFAVLLIAHFLWNPLLLVHLSRTESFRSCFNPIAISSPVVSRLPEYISAVIFSTLLISSAALFGWMWIVVGWTLLIFLAMLVQTHLFTQLYLDNHSV